MKQTLFAPCLVALLALTTACVQTDVLRLEPEPRAPTAPDSVAVLATEPTEPYRVIALVTVWSGDHSVNTLRQKLIQRAAQLGGHAVLLGAESLTRNDESRALSGKVIVFDAGLTAR